MRTLKNELKKNGYTLQQTADALGITYRTLWRKMGYQDEYKLSEIQKLSELTGIPINELALIKQR